MNETAALVWHLCDGKRSVSDICFTLSENWQTIVSAELIWLTLEQFKRDDLLEKTTEFSGNFDGLSRREAVKKIGLTSLIALPMISPIIAPSAVIAQSGGFPTGVSCSADSQCLSGNCSNFSPSVCCAGPSEAQPGTVVGCGSLLDPTCNSVRGNCCSGRTSNSSVFSVLCIGNH